MKLTVEFYISTRYVGSDYKEDLELDVPENLSEYELDKFIQEQYEEWAWEVLDSSWSIKSDYKFKR